MSERLKEVKQLIVERDSFADVDGEIDYPNYDERIFLINDEGHIDWLVERVEELEEENLELAVALENERKEVTTLRGHLNVQEKEET